MKCSATFPRASNSLEARQPTDHVGSSMQSAAPSPTLPLFQRLIRKPDVIAGDCDIHWLENCRKANRA